MKMINHITYALFTLVVTIFFLFGAIEGVKESIWALTLFGIIQVFFLCLLQRKNIIKMARKISQEFENFREEEKKRRKSLLEKFISTVFAIIVVAALTILAALII